MRIYSLEVKEETRLTLSSDNYYELMRIKHKKPSQHFTGESEFSLFVWKEAPEKRSFIWFYMLHTDVDSIQPTSLLTCRHTVVTCAPSRTLL
uniref:Uncharacterized protein n=1 Tax=Gasterosteus aculeatus TaxID=69293 RepID=G3Q4Z2_GASAC